jgi:hypothetical protein
MRSFFFMFCLLLICSCTVQVINGDSNEVEDNKAPKPALEIPAP